MNKKTREQKEYTVFRVSYIGQDESFLKKQEDLIKSYGKPLTEFIDSDLTQMNGFLFNKEDLLGVGISIYLALRDQEARNEEICIQDSKVVLIVYTQCQIDEVVLFFVWHFKTQVVNESREAWEAKNNLVPGACCLKNSSTISALDSREELEFNPDQGALAGVENKKCQYKNQYVACFPTVFPHFVNPENPKAGEFLKNHSLNIPVNMDLTFGPLKDTPDFWYGGEKPGLCTSLYDSIVLDETGLVIKDHNMKNFFSDAIATCFMYQNAIKPLDSGVKTIKHSLLSISLYF